MLNKFNFRKAAPVWMVGFLYILPLIIANTQYYDDIGRSVYGYFSWGIDGRPLSDLFFMILNIGAPATDIAPYPQIISIFLLSTLCYVMHQNFNPEYKYGWLLFTPIFLNPFLVQNLAFRFDSFTMTLSIIAAAIPLLTFKTGGFKSLLCSAFFVLCSLCFYQASLSIFISMMMMYVIYEVKNNVNTDVILSRSSIASLGMLIGYLIYSKVIVPIFVTSDYANGYNKTIGSLDELQSNINYAHEVLHSLITGTAGYLFNTLFLLSFLGAISLTFKVIKHQSRASEKITKISMIFMSIVVIALCIPGPGLALKAMPIGPRVFVGFGMACSVLLVFISFLPFKKDVITNSVALFLLIFSFSFMSTFTNASTSQNKLTARIMGELIEDIDKIGYAQVKTITIDGKPPYTPQAERAVSKFPLLKQMIPNYFDGFLAWGIVNMTAIYAGKDQPAQDRQKRLIAEICQMKMVHNSALYRTYINNNGDFVASFNKPECN
jgi:hypothetical protein